MSRRRGRNSGYNFASDKLKEYESKEEKIRKSLGDDYYEYHHKQYQKDADFEGIMMCISLALVLMMFCACIKG